MQTLNDTTRLIDLRFLGRPSVIATAVLETENGLLLVDPGPSTCLATLLADLRAESIAPADLHGLLLTHIHLDHAGGSGSLVREYPHLGVYVHERGAPHMVDPSRLLSSAGRLYGEHMDWLWGEIAPVPADRIHVLRGGEVLAFGNRSLRVAYTPGHASHHVSFFDEGTGIAFTGDTAGIRIGSLGYVLPPTPPPDIDLEAWETSLAAIRSWDPSGLFVTHFGLNTDVDAHLALVTDELAAWGRISRDILRDDAPGEGLAGRFADVIARRVAQRVGEEAAATYVAAVPSEHCWMGLERYWRKRLPAVNGPA